METALVNVAINVLVLLGGGIAAWSKLSIRLQQMETSYQTLEKRLETRVEKLEETMEARSKTRDDEMKNLQSDIQKNRDNVDRALTEIKIAFARIETRLDVGFNNKHCDCHEKKP